MNETKKIVKINKDIITSKAYNFLEENIKHKIVRIYSDYLLGFKIYTDEIKNNLYILYKVHPTKYELYKVKNVFKPVNFSTEKNLKYLATLNEKPYYVKWISEDKVKNDNSCLIENQEVKIWNIMMCI